jgi:hypothetical protein
MTSAYKTPLMSVLALLIFSVMPLSPIAAQSFDNMGTEFVVGFLSNYDASVTIEIHLTAEQATDVTVEYPFNAPTFSTTVAVTPGSITIVTLPVEASTGWTYGSVSNNAVHAYSDAEFVCYMVNRRDASSDAALALPVDVMNTEYIVITYGGSLLHGGDGGEFAIVALYPNTEVTITPTNDLQGGYTAGVPFTVTLGSGEGFLGLSVFGSGPGADLTGTIITSTRPIGVTNGNKCANVPPNVAACDHVFEVAQATQTWGKKIYATNLPNRPTGSIYRIVASSDNTQVLKDGIPLTTLNRGEDFETPYLPGNVIFEGDKPIFVVQFMAGDDSPGATFGDPAMANLAPSEQYLSNYTFSTVGGGQFAQNFLSVIARNSDVGFLTLDGTPIDAVLYSAIGTTDYSAVVVALTGGTHTTSSPSDPHGITVEGYNNYDSYIFPGGAMFVFIPPEVGDTTEPVCEISIGECIAYGTATDVGDSITGIHSVFLEAGSVNLQIVVDPFIPGDLSVSYSVSLVDPNLPGSGTVTAKDLAGNSCSTLVDLECGVTPQYPIPTNEWINVYCAVPMLNDVPLAPGDVIKAYDPDGVLCGIDVVRADGTFGFMPIYRDDVWSPALDEGAEPGDLISFMINDAEVFTNPEVYWTANGASFEVCDFFTCKTIHLKEGWNLISWNFNYSASIEDFVAKFGDDFCLDVIMSFESGAMTYDPLLPEYSTLDHVDYYHGYWIRMHCDWDIEICGQRIDEEEYIPIETGWNLVSYWPEDPLPVQDAIASILQCTEAVIGFDDGALIWLPGKEPFCTLLEMEELLGYWIKSSCDGSLTYPGWVGGMPSFAGSSGVSFGKHAGSVAPSRSWMSIYGSNLTFDGALLDDNSVIEAYGPSGSLCGTGLYTNGKLRFTAIYGRDKFDSETASYPTIGDLVSIRVNGVRAYPDVAWTGDGASVGISELKSSSGGLSGALPLQYSLGQNYPNPFNPSTVIPFSLKEAGHAQLSVYNLLGQQIKTIIDGELEVGDHQAVWDGTDGNGAVVASGIYFYRLDSSAYSETKKMVLMK